MSGLLSLLEGNTRTGRQRADVERFSLVAAIAFPQLFPEAGLRPEHFRTEVIAQAVAAIPKSDAMLTSEGRINVALLASNAEMPLETLRPVLNAQVYNPDQARAWWRKLADLAAVDDIVAALRIALAAPIAETDAASDLLARLEGVLAGFNAETPGAESPTLLEVTENYVRERAAELASGRRRGVVTGLRILDEWMGGLNAGELLTIVAGGGVGKSTIAMDISRRVARTGNAVLFWSAEMTERQLGQREVHAALGRAISDRAVSGFDLEHGLEQVGKDSHADRIRIEHGSAPTAEKLHAAARRMQNREGLALIVLDHLGCFDTGRPRASEQEQIAFAVASCKNLAKLLDVPFVLLTHFNRQGAIRGSERVKDTSDNVLELRREGDNPLAVTEARLLKARQTGETHMAMQLSYSKLGQTFVEVGECQPSPAAGQGNWVRGGGSASGGAREEAPPWV